MEEIVKTFDKLATKSQVIGDTMEVLVRKSAVLEDLKVLKATKDETKLLQNLSEHAKEEFKSTQTEYQEFMATQQRVQMKMLMLMNILDGSSSTSRRVCDPNNNSELSEEDLSNISVATYAKSAKLKSHPPKTLKFRDFVTPDNLFNEEEFEKIPGYMKGRSSFQDLSDFFNNVVVKMFNEKYRIFYQLRLSMKKEEIDLQVEYREQAKHFEGVKFISANDVLRGLNTNSKSLDKKDDRNLQMLRHLQILKEMRKNNVIAYIWLN